MSTKRLFDVFFAFFTLLIFGIVILICILFASLDTKSFGLFFQKRVGQHGNLFTIFKIKTLNDASEQPTRFGTFLRNTKLDELPQLINVLIGNMSFVGPRPDISGYADKLTEKDKIILHLRPGITGLASLKYRKEEALLGKQENPIQYNDQIIWPDKVRINKWYFQNRTMFMDLKIMLYTVLPNRFEIENFIKNYNKQ